MSKLQKKGLPFLTVPKNDIILIGSCTAVLLFKTLVLITEPLL
jgi:hypothetical protein